MDCFTYNHNQGLKILVASRHIDYRNTDIEIPECSNARLRSEAMLEPLHESSWPLVGMTPLQWEGEDGDSRDDSTGELDMAAAVLPQLVLGDSGPGT